MTERTKDTKRRTRHAQRPTGPSMARTARLADALGQAVAA